jgi:hypothetical protein
LGATLPGQMPDDARWAANTWQFVATMGLAELLGGNPHHTTTEDHISPLINDATCAHIDRVGCAPQADPPIPDQRQ